MAALAEGAESELVRAGIFAPSFGLKEDMPTISLADAYTEDQENIVLRRGEIQRARMRLPELLEQVFTSGTITATNGSKTITASTGAGAFSTSATHKPSWVGRKIYITDDGVVNEYTIASVADLGATLQLTANYTNTGGASLSYYIGTAGTHVQAPDGYAILHYHTLEQMVGGVEIKRLIGFTKAHAYLWDTTWTAWILKHTCASDCELWCTATYNNQCLATNNVDKILAWGTVTASAFAPLSNASGLDIGGATYITKAKYLVAFEGYVIVAHVTVGGTLYPYDFYWPTKDDETDWDQTGDGDAGYKSLQEAGPITGACVWERELIIGSKKRLYHYWIVQAEDVFNGDVLIDVGLLAIHSFVTDGEHRLYWLANDYTIRRLPDGAIVSKGIDPSLKDIKASYEHLVKATYIDEYGIVAFALPLGIDATGNNKIVWYDPNDNSCGKWDIAAAAFGEYTRQSVYTIDTIPFPSIDTIGWPTIDTVENVAGFPLDLCSDYSGYTHAMHAAETDDGEAYTGHFVLSTDLLEKVSGRRLGVSLGQYKRIEQIQAYFRRETAGSATITVKRDNEKVFQSLGSVVLSDETEPDIVVADVPCDVRGRHFLIKVSATNAMRFIGLIFDFLIDGVR